jgi:hypothetical protein
MADHAGVSPPPPEPGSGLAPPTPAPAHGAGVIASGRGPLGSRRSALLVVLLSIVTCGIWTIVWSYQNGEELRRHTDTGIGGLGYLFITLLVSPATMFLMADEVAELYRREGRQPPITAIWGLWFLLPIIGNLIWYVTIQSALNDYWTRHGATNNPGL